MSKNFASNLENNINNSFSTQYSDKLDNVFIKVDPLKQVKIGGGEAQIIFINTKHKKTRSEDRNALDQQKNEYICDGGLRERNMKYYNSLTFNKVNAAPKKSSSMNSKLDPNSVNPLTTYNASMKEGTIQKSEHNNAVMTGSNISDSNKAQPKKIFDINSKGTSLKKEVKVIIKNDEKRSLNEMLEKEKTNLRTKKLSSELFRDKTRAISAEIKKRNSSNPKSKNLSGNVKSQFEKDIEKNLKPKEKNNEKDLFKIELNDKKETRINSNNQKINSLERNQANEKNQIDKKENRIIKNKIQENSKNSENENRPKKNTLEDKKSEKNFQKNNMVVKDSQISQNTNEMNRTNSMNSINNPPKIKNKSKHSDSSIKESTQKVLSGEEKIDLMEKLVKNKEEEIIKEVKKEVLKKGKNVNDKIQRKLNYLRENNMLDNINFEIEGGIEELKETVDMDNYSQEERNNIIKHSKTRFNNFIGSNTKGLNNYRSKSTPLIEKKILKPKVDSLEFYAQILNERRVNIIGNSEIKGNETLNTNTDENHSHRTLLNNTEKQKEQNNSFRKSNSEERSKAFRPDSKRLQIYESIDKNIMFSYKNRTRSSDEIKEFIIKKKREEKENAIKLEKEVNDKMLKRLIELTKIYEKQHQIIYIPTNKEIKRGIHNMNMSQVSNSNKSSKLRSSSHKIKNEMFVGRNNRSKLDDSSILEADDYYLSVLESKNILGSQSINIGGKISKKYSLSSQNDPEKKESYNDLKNFGFGYVSHLSNFSKNSRKQFEMNYNIDDLNIDDKHVYNSQTGKEVRQFLNKKEKEITIRSLDSNDLLSSKSNKDTNVNLNTGKFNSNNDHDGLVNSQNKIKQINSKLSDMKAKVNEIKKSGINFKEYTSTLSNKSRSGKNLNSNSINKDVSINTNSSKENVNLGVNYVHTDLEFEAVKEHQFSDSDYNRKYNNKEVNDSINISNKSNKELYISKQQEKLKPTITKDDLAQLINLLKYVNNKNVFYSLIQQAQYKMLMEHYDDSFKYLDQLYEVFIMRNVFQAFNNIRENAVVNNYHEVFNFFSIPAKRNAFNKIKEFSEIMKLYEQEQIKIYQNVLESLALFAKRDAFNSIKNYVLNKEHNLNQEDEEKILEIYSSAFSIITNPWKRDAFYTIGKYAFKIQDSLSENKIDIDESANLHDQSISNSNNWFNKDIKDDFDSPIGRSDEKNKDQNLSEDLKIKNLDKNDVNELHSISRNKSSVSLNSNKGKIVLDKSKILKSLSNRSNKQSERSQNGQSDSNNQSIADIKMNSYIQSYSDGNNSIQVIPNNVDSPPLHRLYDLIERQKIEKISNERDQEIIPISQNNISQNTSIVTENILGEYYNQNHSNDEHKGVKFSSISHSRKHSENESINNKSINSMSKVLESANRKPNNKDNSIDEQGKSDISYNNYDRDRSVTPISNLSISNHSFNDKGNNLKTKSQEMKNENNRLNNSDDLVTRPKKNYSNENGLNSKLTNEHNDKLIEENIQNENLSGKFENIKKPILNNLDVSSDISQNNNKVIKDEENDEIQEEIVEEPVKFKSSNYTRRESDKMAIETDNDISADKDNNSDIEWVHSISNSKSSGSFREINFNTRINSNRRHNEYENNPNNIQSSILNSIKEDNIQEEISKEEKRESNFEGNEKEKKQDTPPFADEVVNTNDIKHKKNDSKTDEDDDKYDEFDEEIDIEEKEEDNSKDILEIISESNVDNTLNIINPTPNTQINNNEMNNSSINSFKSRNNVSEKKRLEDKNSNFNTDSVNPKNKELTNPVESNEENLNNNQNEVPADINCNNEDRDEYKEIKDAARVDLEINNNEDRDLENERIIIDENNINEKITIESSDYNFNNKENNNAQSNIISKEKQSIDSNEESGGFFIVKTTNDMNLLNLLDNKSSNAKSLVNMPITPESNKHNKNLNHFVSNVFDLDSKNNKTISINQNLSVNKRYDNLLDESSVRKTERSAELEDKLISINLNELSEEITNYILADILVSQIKDSRYPLIPKKSFKFDALIGINPNSSISSLNLNNGENKNDSSLNESNNSQIGNNLNISMFMKTIVDFKKETTLNLYNENVAPKLIHNIGKSIESNYNTIVNNLSIPYSNNPTLLIESLIKRDPNLLKSANKFLPEEIKEKPLIEKNTILSNFDKVNKHIREENNIMTDNYYDKIVNECMIDASNELLNKERLYGDLGEPLPWSNRTRIITFKYNKSQNSKNNLKIHIEKQLTQMVNNKIGMIAENYQDYLDLDQLNSEREKRLMNNIIKELTESEEIWKNFDLEETQIKLELTEMVLEQLLNEVVEILEHVQLSRRRPNLYNYKSIYSCEDIPRLSFQQYNTESDNINQ